MIDSFRRRFKTGGVNPFVSTRISAPAEAGPSTPHLAWPMVAGDIARSITPPAPPVQGFGRSNPISNLLQKGSTTVCIIRPLGRGDAVVGSIVRPRRPQELDYVLAHPSYRCLTAFHRADWMMCANSQKWCCYLQSRCLIQVNAQS